MPFQDAFSREIWTQIGAEGDAAFLAPRYGVPLFAGGFLGEAPGSGPIRSAFHPELFGRVRSEDHLRPAHRDAEERWPSRTVGQRSVGGPPDEAKARRQTQCLPVGSGLYNNDLFKGGWAGQGLLVNPDRDLVAVYAGYFNDDQSELQVLPRLRQVLNGLFAEVEAPE